MFNLNFKTNHSFHIGPIIRREEDYINLSITERRKLLNKIVTFTKKCDISYISFYVEKKHLIDTIHLTQSLTKQLSIFIKNNMKYFVSFDKIILYYDNGQIDLTKILASVFTVLLPQTEFRKVLPIDYRLFQVADLICSFELLNLKVNNNLLSKSEIAFFGSLRDMKKNYLKPIQKKKFVYNS